MRRGEREYGRQWREQVCRRMETAGMQDKSTGDERTKEESWRERQWRQTIERDDGVTFTRQEHRGYERWGAGVETPKNVREEIGGWGRVTFNEP